MSNEKEERMDNLLGGIAIILIGLLLSSSAIWGLVDNVYSMNGGLAPIMFIILGFGSIILGCSYLFINLRRKQLQFAAEKKRYLNRRCRG